MEADKKKTFDASILSSLNNLYEKYSKKERKRNDSTVPIRIISSTYPVKNDNTESDTG